ncbi:MAG TPA: anthranilate synthase component I family protein [Candidatus Limnocylindrales bacterium]|nr:anthranilate synthase component I family protein [Candidatus Limnocylindrales bacterium]
MLPSTLPGARTLPGLLLERLPWLESTPPAEAAERLRHLPGLLLMESARPGQRSRWSYLAADPLLTLAAPAPGSDPFAEARAVLGRLDPTPPGAADAPPFAGGLAGLLSYDLGRRFERLPAMALEDQQLPELRLGLYDLVVAWDRRTGAAWLAGRALDGDLDRLARRREALLALLTGRAAATPASAGASGAPPARFRSNRDRHGFERMVGQVREAIATGELYQANVARRLEASFAGDPWPLYRRLRIGDPVPYAAFLDLGPDEAGRRRALLSASPEPFLSVEPGGRVSTDPIKGTRPRGRSPEADRCLAAELLASVKDRAENTMIVDVLRNDLGRVCLPGSVRVPRLCRLERTAAVQHLVSTVTGQLTPGQDPLDLLAAAFPGGSITGAPKIRAMELIEALEPVRRGPYTGSLVWVGPDGRLGSSILIRTFVADGTRLTLHVGGGITWRSEPTAEWEETRTKARGPLAALGADEAE